MNRRAFSLAELLITIAIAVILIAALLPTLRQTRSSSGQLTSMANLQSLSLAHAMYGWDWNDRQVTWVPDDAGIFALGEANWAPSYVAEAGCPSQLFLGWDSGALPTMWAYFLGCGGFPGATNNGPFYVPMNIGAAQTRGSFRFPNALAFAPYVDGRYYSESFFAPNDEITWEFASMMFDFEAGFTLLPTGSPLQFVNSSYALSPAAMWNPKVFSPAMAGAPWYTAPSTLIDAYQSPSVSQCVYPDLKTRMIEHNWNLGAPAPTNPAFDDGLTPYYFNHGLDAAPLTLFFDGHVAELSTAQAVADDAMVLSETRGEVGLWTRDTPFGELGYFGAQSFDGTLASHHILTAGGILGRDVLGTAAPAARSEPARAWRPTRFGHRTPAPQALIFK